jgi:hypothetical protein
MNTMALHQREWWQECGSYEKRSLDGTIFVNLINEQTNHAPFVEMHGEPYS